MPNQPVNSETEQFKTEQLDQSSQTAMPKPKSGQAESGGPKGAEPTRYGDWEINGKCVDF